VRAGACDSLVALAETLGAPVFHEGLRAQLSFPNRHRCYRGRVPFEAGLTVKLLDPYDLIVLIGGPFFEDIWYDGVSPLPAGARVLQIENNDRQLGFNFSLDLGLTGDLRLCLMDLVAELGVEHPAFSEAAAARNAVRATEYETRSAQAQAALEHCWNDTQLAPTRALHEIATALPPGTVLVDESITAYGDVAQQFDFRAPGDYFSGRGGGIGQGIAGAIGVQVACPDKRVVALSGDGSAMYSIQALWSAAHHRLPIVFIILSNREYRVLKYNLDTYRRRFEVPAEKPYPHMDLADPALDFVSMAKGMGVAGELITDAADVGAAVRRALQSGSPYLLELVVSGKA
jgi:benzoylformate decarboxylase